MRTRAADDALRTRSADWGVATTAPRGLDDLAAMLLAVREAAGLSGVEAGRRAGFSQAKVSRIERGRTIATPADVEVLTRAYGADEDTRLRLVGLAEDVRAENRRVVMVRNKAADFQERIARIEATAKEIGDFTPAVVPGLLQTEAYMRELAAPAGLDEDTLERWVVARLNRQRLLDDPRRRFTVIVTAGALGWRAETPAERAAQVDHIIERSMLPHARIGVIPWGARATRFPLHGWGIYDRKLVMVGTMNATAVLSEPSDVGIYTELFDELTTAARFGEEGREVLHGIAEDYRRPEDAT